MTNVIAASLVATEPVGEKTDSSGFSWTTPAIAIAGIGLFLLASKIWRLMKGLTRHPMEEVDELVNDILDAVAKNVPDRTALHAELLDAVVGSGSLRTGPLDSILRIEESYEKLPSGKYLRRVSVLQRKKDSSETGSLAKIENEIGWEFVPSGIRDRFVETRENKVVRLVYDAKGKPPA